MTTLNGTQQRILEACFTKVPLDFILARAEKELGVTPPNEPDITTPLKKGGKVRVRKRKPEWDDEAPGYTDKMVRDFEGGLYIVESIVSTSGNAHFAGYFWKRHWLEKVEE